MLQISIHHDDIFRSCLSYAHHRRGQAPLVCSRNDPDRVARSQARYQLGRAVGAIVINKNNFTFVSVKIVINLFYKRPDIFPFIKGGDYY